MEQRCQLIELDGDPLNLSQLNGPMNIEVLFHDEDALVNVKVPNFPFSGEIHGQMADGAITVTIPEHGTPPISSTSHSFLGLMDM